MNALSPQIATQQDGDSRRDVIVSLAGVGKSYGGPRPALQHLDLEIGRGEFFTLLGPSGSGKTTTLRLIAGFEQPTSGRIMLDGVDVAGRPPQSRNVNTMFQDYALFPHMTVRENVAFGLKARRVGAAEAGRRAGEALELVQLGEFGARRPSQLSGGQRQRVALARALVNRPAVLLLDEPLGALDLKLRHQMQVELKDVQRKTGITFVCVTHDQEEALTMSDRIAVFSDGRLEQVGSPRELYERPASLFVADFIGTSSVLVRNGRRAILRPEHVDVLPARTDLPPDHEGQQAVVVGLAFVGSYTRCALRLEDGTSLTAVLPERRGRDRPAMPLEVGNGVVACWPRDAVFVLPV